MIITHSGIDIDTEKDPVGAIKLCLDAAKNCGSKSKAWYWAECALSVVSAQHYSRFKELLGNGRYPDCSFDIKFLEA